MHKKMLTACCAVIATLLLLLPLPVGAAAAGDVGEAYAAAVYDNASGMPFSEANLTIQTPDGFLYIGSYGGLTRFDGRRFEAVEGVSSAVSLFTDSRGRLWVGTSEMGAVCLDGGSLTVYGPEEGLNSSVRGFCEEENGDILMATRSGLFLLDGNGQISQLPDELRLLIDEHIPSAVTQVFFIYMKFADQLRNDTLRDGACFFFVLADSGLA